MVKSEKTMSVDLALEKIKEFASQIENFREFSKDLRMFMEKKYPKWGWHFITGHIGISDGRVLNYLQLLSETLTGAKVNYPKKD